MEPITSLIVTAVALGAAAGLKPATEQAVKDAYEGFKQIIIDRYNDHRDLIKALEALDQKPKDTDRQTILGNELIKVGATKDPVLIEAANAIHIAGMVHDVQKRVLRKRLQRKLQQVEALEDQIDLTLSANAEQKVILQERAETLWTEIQELEREITQMG